MQQRAAHDHAGVVDVLRHNELVGECGTDQRVEILHDAVLPQERPVRRAARDADHLTRRIDAEALTVVVSRQRAEVLYATRPRPEEGMRVEVDPDVDPEVPAGGGAGIGFELAVQNGADEFASNNDNDKPAVSAAGIARFAHDSWVVVGARFNPRTHIEGSILAAIGVTA